MLGAFALFSASVGMAVPDAGTDGAQPLSNAVVQADVLPSIEILSKQLNLAGRCNGSAFDLNTFINTTAQTSASVRVSSTAVNPSLLEQFKQADGLRGASDRVTRPKYWVQKEGEALEKARARGKMADRAQAARAAAFRNHIADLIKSAKSG